MGQSTGIEWCDHTWSPWWGCTKWSPGCAHCYAAELAGRFRGMQYVRGEPRQLAKDWKQVLKWDRQADKDGIRRRIFPSMCDVFDAEVDPKWREEFWALVKTCTALDWLILTKRAENFSAMWPPTRDPLHQVWLGVSVENQEYADLRLPLLAAVPAKVRFVSYEPALGPVDFRWGIYADPAGGFRGTSLENIHWVIFGGESGKQSRPCDVQWARFCVQQCQAAKVPVFVKQLGGNIVGEVGEAAFAQDKKGGDPGEWPLDLRVREFPLCAD